MLLCWIVTVSYSAELYVSLGICRILVETVMIICVELIVCCAVEDRSSVSDIFLCISSLPCPGMFRFVHVLPCGLRLLLHPFPLPFINSFIDVTPLSCSPPSSLQILSPHPQALYPSSKIWCKLHWQDLASGHALRRESR